jgi:hypothetical protein
MLAACGKKEKTIIDESIDNTILFGEKTGEQDLKMKNLFTIGEEVTFYVKLSKPIRASSVTFQLFKLKDEGWEKLSEAPLEVKPDWKEFMNGLPGTIFEQTGDGVYKVIILKGEKELTKGEFIIELK